MTQTNHEKLAEIAFRQGADWSAPTNLAYARKIAEERRSFLAAMAMQQRLASPVLEIGAEHCLNSMILEAEMGLTTVAIDLSPEALAGAAGLARELGLRVPAVRAAADAERLPFVAGSFRTVVLWGTLHHFSDTSLLMEEIRRVLAPGGWLILAEEPVRRRLSLALGRTAAANRLRGFSRFLMRLHLLPWFVRIGGAEETAAGLTEADFSITQINTLMSRFVDTRWFFQPILTGGHPSAGPLGRWLWRLMVPSRHLDESLTRWFGGSLSGWAQRPAPLVELGGDRYMVRKHPAHDMIALRGFVGAFLCQGETVRADDSIAALPAAVLGRQLLVLQIPRRPSRIDLWSSSGAAGLVVYYLPEAPATDPASSLACPDCVMFTDRCVIGSCRMECVPACPKNALAPNDPSRPIRKNCDGCGVCLAACSYGGLDRSPLQGNRCRQCGKVFPSTEDVLELRPVKLRMKPGEVHPA